jgi:hypothetical protein
VLITGLLISMRQRRCRSFLTRPFFEGSTIIRVRPDRMQLSCYTIGMRGSRRECTHESVYRSPQSSPLPSGQRPHQHILRRCVAPWRDSTLASSVYSAHMISVGNNINARGGVDGICDGFPTHAGIIACEAFDRIHEARFKRRLEGGGTALLPATHCRNHGTRTARCRSLSSPGLPPPMAHPPSSSCFTEDSNAADPTFLRDQLDLPLSPRSPRAVPVRACAITARDGLPPAHACSATTTCGRPSERVQDRQSSETARELSAAFRRAIKSMPYLFAIMSVAIFSLLLETQSLTLVR